VDAHQCMHATAPASTTQRCTPGNSLLLALWAVAHSWVCTCGCPACCCACCAFSMCSRPSCHACTACNKSRPSSQAGGKRGGAWNERQQQQPPMPPHHNSSATQYPGQYGEGMGPGKPNGLYPLRRTSIWVCLAAAGMHEGHDHMHVHCAHC
jgi:hypothetical protein